MQADRALRARLRWTQKRRNLDSLSAPNGRGIGLAPRASDEIWLWQGGDPLDLLIAAERGAGAQTVRLGTDRFQAVVRGGKWQAARPVARGTNGCFAFTAELQSVD